ncbi:MAG TPA: hypothetical protein VKB67_00910 [Rhizomicrobium sp.]|nr:hypothetical protein [Rhizomicrobium sp.]
MRVFIAGVLATTLIASSALADDGALAPGKPAGVKQAQMTENEMWIALGAAAVAGGIVIAATSQSHHQATTTTSTSP